MTNHVKKVIIPAAGWGTRFLPLTKVTPKELVPILNKPIIHYLAQEAAMAGIEEVILIISPRKLEILKYFTINSELESELKKKHKIELLHRVLETNKLVKISIAIQNEQLGLGHAIMMGADLVGDDPFAVILGDDLISAKVPAIKQLIDVFEQTGKSIIGVQKVPKQDLAKYGVVAPLKKIDSPLFAITGAVEKPIASQAPSTHAILGRYIFTPRSMELLRSLKPGKGNEINVVDIFATLAQEEGLMAFEFTGERFDLGSMEGFVKANIAYALENQDISSKIKNYMNQKIS